MKAGVNAAATPAPADGPLQLMPKRKKKAAPSADVETLPVFDAAVSEAAVTMPHADPRRNGDSGPEEKEEEVPGAGGAEYLAGGGGGGIQKVY